MNYILEKEDNSIVTCVFDEAVTVEASVYNRINHHINLMLPCMRDLSDPTRVHYDVLGVTPLDETIRHQDFDRRALYDLICQIADRMEAVIHLGIDMSQIVLDSANVYVSDFDGSLRWLCLPVKAETPDSDKKWMLFLRDLVLSISSNGAYDLIGFVIEKASGEGKDIADFKREWMQTFSEKTGNGNAGRFRPEEASPIPSDGGLSGGEPVTGKNPLLSAAEATIRTAPSVTPTSGSSGVTQGIPYLAPVGDNAESARTYITGGRLTVGRLPDNNLCISLSKISRHHAEITVTKDGCSLVDLGSVNGTYLNGNPIVPHVPFVLNHQDTISFNKNQYIFYAY